jgi:serine/threonine protein kinase
MTTTDIEQIIKTVKTLTSSPQASKDLRFLLATLQTFLNSVKQVELKEEVKSEEEVELEEDQRTPEEELNAYKKMILGPDLTLKCNVKIDEVSIGDIEAREKQSGYKDFQILRTCKLHTLTFNDKAEGPHVINTSSCAKKPLGTGGFGQVTNCGGKAIKKFLEKPDINELDIVMRFKHPNILQAENFAFDKDKMLLITLPMARGDLGHIHTLAPKLSLPNKLKYIYELICAMAFLQSQGYFHCDLKPGNVLIFEEDKSKNEADGSKFKAVLADMGFVYPYKYGLRDSDESFRCGTPYYAPIEGKRGFQVGPELKKAFEKSNALSTDMFFLGNVCFFILTGNLIHGTQDENIADDPHDADVKKNIKTPDKFWSDIQAKYKDVGLTDKRLKWFKKTLNLYPEQRPTNYIELVDEDMFGATPNFKMPEKIITGYAVYKDLKGNLQRIIDGRDLDSFKYGLKGLFTGLDTVKDNELKFDAIQLYYRYFYLSAPDNSPYSIVDACVLLSEILSWKNHSLTENARKIIVALNGQLRYPYVLELILRSTPELINEFLDLARNDPETFATILKNPEGYFTDVAFENYNKYI